MIVIDFICPGCGKQVIGVNPLQYWNAQGKPTCSRECQRRVTEAIRGVNVSDFIKVLDGDPNFERMTKKPEAMK